MTSFSDIVKYQTNDEAKKRTDRSREMADVENTGMFDLEMEGGTL